MRLPTLALATALLAPTMALADSNLPPDRLAYTELPDARQEAAAAALMAEVRCLVCQGQSIADSNAELAGDMRAMIRARVAAGEKPATIRSWLVRRYGSWVSYDPPFTASSAPLWLLPLLLAGVGVVLARRVFRRG